MLKYPSRPHPSSTLDFHNVPADYPIELMRDYFQVFG